MAKLDRLGWAEGLTLSAFGVRVGVRANNPGVLDRVLPLLPPAWKEHFAGGEVQRLYSLIAGESSKRSGTRRLHVLYANDVRIDRSSTLDQVLETFETDVHRYIAEASSEKTFLHAGVVGWQGRAILLPGQSFSGKTTLVREMLRLGATYYSDEFAVIDNAGLVHSFARPLGIREEGSQVQTKRVAEELGAIRGAAPLPVCLVAFSEYKAEAQWQPAPLSRGRGILELLAHSIAIRSQPGQTLARLHELARQTKFIKGVRGEAREAAASILNDW